MDMEKLANDIQRVINTLEGLDIKSTFDNMNRLLGSLQVLATVRDQLQEVEQDGNPDAE